MWDGMMKIIEKCRVQLAEIAEARTFRPESANGHLLAWVRGHYICVYIHVYRRQLACHWLVLIELDCFGSSTHLTELAA